MATETKATTAPATQPPPADYLFAGPAKLAPVRNVSLDFSTLTAEFLDKLASEEATPGSQAELQLLPPQHRWLDETGKVQNVPVPLCEFLAYKAALAYEEKATIERHLGVDNPRFQFFNTANDRPRTADTQGYGFVHQGMAFIVMRGSMQDEDWETNFLDTLTSDLELRNGQYVVPGKAGLKKLELPQPDRLRELVVDTKAPGRHLGFTIAWGAVRPQIEAWIKANGFADDMPYVFAGHSLGGALAKLGAYEFASAFHGTRSRKVAAVVTFGAPTVGNTVFADDYNHRLGHCTVRIEATADIVPVVMRRWYYRLDQTRRELIRKGLVFSEIFDKAQRFTHVGPGWRFPQQPPLSKGEFDDAVRAFHQEEERKRQEEKKKQEAAAKKPDATGAPDARPASQGSPAATSPAGPSEQSRTRQAEATPTSAPASGDGSSTPATPPRGQSPEDLARYAVMVGIGAFAFAVAGFIVWVFIYFFKKRKVAVHAIMEHYALYLSTLSYQHIRALRSGDLERANEDLKHYVWMIRGDSNADDYYVRRKMRGLPLPLEPGYEVASYIARNPNSHMC